MGTVVSVSMTQVRDGLFHRVAVNMEAEIKRAISSGTATFTVTLGPEITKSVDVPICKDGSCSSPGKVSLSMPLDLRLLPKQYDANAQITGYTPGFQGERILQCGGTLSWTVEFMKVDSDGDFLLV